EQPTNAEAIITAAQTFKTVFFIIFLRKYLSLCKIIFHNLKLSNFLFLLTNLIAKKIQLRNSFLLML
ncbi:MAG: hypothetical protein SPK10_10465, partial [Treponema sp.]|nr:hypothetical protein [Treponema sp.]MDY5765205.1 hypothetical protein [Treponema sp.]